MRATRCQERFLHEQDARSWSRDARVTSGALYMQGPLRVFRGLGLGFQGLESKQPRSGSSATPYTHPEARHAPKKFLTQIISYHLFNFGAKGTMDLIVVW